MSNLYGKLADDRGEMIKRFVITVGLEELMMIVESLRQASNIASQAMEKGGHSGHAISLDNLADQLDPHNK